MPIKSFNRIAPKIDATVFVADDAFVIGDVEIDEEASIWFGAVLRGDVNYIRIGARTNIQDASVIHVSSKDHPTILEHEITVGHRVTLHGCYVETAVSSASGRSCSTVHASDEIPLLPPAVSSRPAP
jgi:carbonic anhydrase/acetyltransferase-like protein (isoleucine patch superfamily)